MRRRSLIGAAAVAASSLAFAGVSGPAVAGAKTKPSAAAKSKKKKKKAKPVAVKATCQLVLTVVPPTDQTSVVPPLDSGSEFGTSSCGKVGSGLASLAFTNNVDSGETTGSMTVLTGTGGVKGKFTLAQSDDQPPPTAYSFGNADLVGSVKVTGGSGALAKVKGKGTLECVTTDAVHYSCSAKLKLTLPPASAAS